MMHRFFVLLLLAQAAFAVTSPARSESGGRSFLSESAAAVAFLEERLQESPESLDGVLKSKVARTALSKEDSAKAEDLIRAWATARIRSDRTEEMQKRLLTIGKLKMPFFYRTFGKKPESGWSLYISMHGGGGTTARVNDQQWENQKRLYQLKEGIYLAPRAPTNTWNLWHQRHIDKFFLRLISNMVVFENVDPDRVFLMGYSAGGDGVYQLAPRLADHFAAASMMAGHPNETSPLGLRNLPFTIHVGERDSGYNRNAKARDWKASLAGLHKKDPKGYTHLVKLHAGRGHWMNREDREAIDWMEKYRRQRYPERIVWKQDDVTHDRFYWLSLPKESVKARGLIVASRSGQSIEIESADVEQLTLLLSDSFIDLDKPVVIKSGKAELFRGTVPRTVETAARTILDDGGLGGSFAASQKVKLTRSSQATK